MEGGSACKKNPGVSACYLSQILVVGGVGVLALEGAVAVDGAGGLAAHVGLRALEEWGGACVREYRFA